MGGMTIYSITL